MNIGRMVAFVRGNMEAAENLGTLPSVLPVAWLQSAVAAGSTDVVEYGLEAALRSAEDANSAVKGIQDKAGSLLTLLLGIAPLLIGAIAIAAPKVVSTTGVVSVAFFLLAGSAFAHAIVMAALASGLSLGGGLNLSRMGQAGKSSLLELKASEADAWHFAAMMAMEASTRKAADLFQARRYALIALLLGLIGLILLLIAVGGDVRQLITPSSPTPSGLPSPS